MSDKNVRLCGSTWVYCNGMCNDCSRSYHHSINKTVFDINSKSYLNTEKERLRLEGAKAFCDKLKSRVGVLGRYSGYEISELADNILERMSQ